jgi:hypothetical protein
VCPLVRCTGPALLASGGGGRWYLGRRYL